MNKYTKDRFIKWNEETLYNLYRDSSLSPMWVADMDFKTSKKLANKLIQMSNNRIFGYSADTKPEIYLKKWLKSKYEIDVLESDFIVTSGTIITLSVLIDKMTNKNAKVAYFNPSYYVFNKIITRLEKIPCPFEFSFDDNGQPYINFDILENFFNSNNIECFLLSNPNNPLGIELKEEDLLKLILLCEKYSILIISDEVHCDFCFDNKHNFLFELNNYNNFLVLLSPSKTFSISGLKISYIVCKNEKLKSKMKKILSNYSLLDPNCFAREAVKTIYTNQKWFDNIYNKIKRNIIHSKQFLCKYLPNLKIIDSNATYLLWLDFSNYFSKEEIINFFEKKCKIAVDYGYIYGENYSSCIRLNVACSSYKLKRVLKIIIKHLNN